MHYRRQTQLPDESLREGLSGASAPTIIKTVLDSTGFTLDEVTGKTRKLPVVTARHIITYFLSVNMDRSFSAIGHLFGTDHSTAMHSRNVAENWMLTSHAFKLNIIKLSRHIINNQMKQKVQLIGKVTGLNRIDAAIKFKESQNRMELEGYQVLNPMQLVPADAPWAEAMRICLRSLLEVDAVAVHPDWHMSEGARIEYMVADALQLKMIRL